MQAMPETKPPSAPAGHRTVLEVTVNNHPGVMSHVWNTSKSLSSRAIRLGSARPELSSSEVCLAIASAAGEAGGCIAAVVGVITGRGSERVT